VWTSCVDHLMCAPSAVECSRVTDDLVTCDWPQAAMQGLGFDDETDLQRFVNKYAASTHKNEVWCTILYSLTSPLALVLGWRHVGE